MPFEDAKEWRPPSDEERAFVTLLLNSVPNAEIYMEQLALCTVRESCSCGCPSIEFSVPFGAAPYIERRAVATFAAGSTEQPIWVGLVMETGFLSELEITDLIGDLTRPFPLPAISQIRMEF